MVLNAKNKEEFQFILAEKKSHHDVKTKGKYLNVVKPVFNKTAV